MHRWLSFTNQVATTENRDLQLAVLSLFAERELTDPALTLEDLLNALPHQAPDRNADEPGIRRSLDQLVEWQLLDESRNESATYRTPEEFQQLPEAMPGDHAYRYLIRDRDAKFSSRLDESIRRLRLQILKTPVRTLQANGICERTIGAIPRECLDYLIPLGEEHLCRILVA
jgi:hypothetical protein